MPARERPATRGTAVRAARRDGRCRRRRAARRAARSARRTVRASVGAGRLGHRRARPGLPVDPEVDRPQPPLEARHAAEPPLGGVVAPQREPLEPGVAERRWCGSPTAARPRAAGPGPARATPRRRAPPRRRRSRGRRTRRSSPRRDPSTSHHVRQPVGVAPARAPPCTSRSRASRPTASPSASASARYSSIVSSGGKRSRTFWYSKNEIARATGSRSTSTIRGRSSTSSHRPGDRGAAVEVRRRRLEPHRPVGRGGEVPRPTRRAASSGSP